jgi:hypothetical protein
LQLPLNFWWKSHAKWAKLKFKSLIISDQGKKTKIPSRHDLDISINYIPTQCGLQIWCFAIAIKFFVKTHLSSRKSRDIWGSCMSHTLAEYIALHQQNLGRLQPSAADLCRAVQSLQTIAVLAVLAVLAEKVYYLSRPAADLLQSAAAYR